MIRLEGGIVRCGISIPRKEKNEVVVVSSYDKLESLVIMISFSTLIIAVIALAYKMSQKK